MKRLATIIAAIALIGRPAFAADMAVKAPPPPPAPVYTWTGWYVGGNVGYGWGDARTNLAGAGTTPGLFGSMASPFFFPGPNFAFADSGNARLNGIIGGGQVGHNYQFSPKWVSGFEADIQGSDERGSNAFVDSFSAPLCEGVAPINKCGLFGSLNGTTVTGYEAKIDWFGTVRGRLGYLITDQTLLYATGGLAYGQIGLSGNANLNGSSKKPLNPAVPLSTPATSAFSESRTNIGWTAGAGIEGRFAYWLPAGWTWKLEYLYVDLGSLDTVSSLTGAFQVGIPITGTITTHTHFTDNIVRVGLNYQFH